MATAAHEIAQAFGIYNNNLIPIAITTLSM